MEVLWQIGAGEIKRSRLLADLGKSRTGGIQPAVGWQLPLLAILIEDLQNWLTTAV
jgi:hypothetical protein